MSSELLEFVSAGNRLLGAAAALGVVIGVLALIIIAGRMIHANFTGDPWIAARGMAELPWVLLGICLLAGAGGLVTMFFQGSQHEAGQDLGELLRGVEESVLEAEEGVLEDQLELRISQGCLPLEGGPIDGRFVCHPESSVDGAESEENSDAWEENHDTDAIPRQGDNDPRCTFTGDYENCREYCDRNSGYSAPENVDDAFVGPEICRDLIDPPDEFVWEEELV